MHRAYGHHVFISPLITHDAHGLHREQHGKCLPDILVFRQWADFLLHAQVGLLEHANPVGSHAAQYAHGKSRPGKRLAIHDCVWQSEFPAQRANLVLEQIAQRFNQLELQVRREPADVVVALDRHGGTADRRRTLDHVRIERALRKKFHFTQFPRLIRKNINECCPNDLSLLLRITDAVETLKEKVLRACNPKINAEMFAKRFFHLLRLAVAQQAVIHENAMKLAADCLVEQGRHDGRIHATAQSAKDVAAADGVANDAHALRDELRHFPVARAAAGVEKKAT